MLTFRSDVLSIEDFVVTKEIDSDFETNLSYGFIDYSDLLHNIKPHVPAISLKYCTLFHVEMHRTIKNLNRMSANDLSSYVDFFHLKLTSFKRTLRNCLLTNTIDSCVFLYIILLNCLIIITL